MSESGKPVLKWLEEQVERSTLDLSQNGDSLTLSHPKAPEKAVTMSLDVLQQSAPSEPETRSWVASFLEGVTAEIRPDLRTSIDQLTFVDAAGRLVVRLEGPGFMEGVEHAGGDEPWTREWEDHLILSFWVELDDGLALLRRRHVEQWGCTSDRVWCAARSVMHHKSRNRNEPVAGEVERYHVGDGYDSARVIVVEDLEWQRSGDGLWVGVPSDGELLFRVPGDGTGDLESFRRLVEAAWEQARYPLSRDVFHLQRGKATALS